MCLECERTYRRSYGFACVVDVVFVVNVVFVDVSVFGGDGNYDIIRRCRIM
jgi:hypothetical protein